MLVGANYKIRKKVIDKCKKMGMEYVFGYDERDFMPTIHYVSYFDGEIVGYVSYSIINNAVSKIEVVIFKKYPSIIKEITQTLNKVKKIVSGIMIVIDLKSPSISYAKKLFGAGAKECDGFLLCKWGDVSD